MRDMIGVMEWGGACFGLSVVRVSTDRVAAASKLARTGCHRAEGSFEPSDLAAHG